MEKDILLHTILLIESNYVARHQLRTLLADRYTVVQAHTGVMAHSLLCLAPRPMVALVDLAYLPDRDLLVEKVLHDPVLAQTHRYLLLGHEHTSMVPWPVIDPPWNAFSLHQAFGEAWRSFATDANGPDLAAQMVIPQDLVPV